jgi:hypothetical protein
MIELEVTQALVEPTDGALLTDEVQGTGVGLITKMIPSHPTTSNVPNRTLANEEHGDMERSLSVSSASEASAQRTLIPQTRAACNDDIQ